MKKAKIAALILGVLLATIGVVMASETSVLSDYKYGSLVGNAPLIQNATEAENPDVLYVLIIAEEPLRSVLQEEVSKVAHSHGLKTVNVPTPAREDLQGLQFKGRFLSIYVRRLDMKHGLLSRKYSADVFVYYSSAGDVESFYRVYENAEDMDFDEMVDSIKRSLPEKRINVRGDWGIAYRKNLKVYVGYLARKPADYPWRAMAEDIMGDVEDFLRSAEV